MIHQQTTNDNSTARETCSAKRERDFYLLIDDCRARPPAGEHTPPHRVSNPLRGTAELCDYLPVAVGPGGQLSRKTSTPSAMPIGHER